MYNTKDNLEYNMSEKAPEEGWTTVIDSEGKNSISKLKELWSVRDLILLFVRRDFVTFYKQTILGPLWFFIQPLLMTIVFTIVFGRIAKIPTDGIPPFLFYMSGIVLWSYFSSCLEKTSIVFIENQSVFSKVYFPRLAVPVSTVITNLFAFGIQFGTFLGFLIYYILLGSDFTPFWFAPFILPFLLLNVALLGMGFGLIVTALTTKYRDLAFVVTFGIQLWMYATPIVYPLSQVPERFQWIILLNPMAGNIETFRYIFLGTGTIHLVGLALSICSTIIIFSLGTYLFNRAEKTFIDTV